MAAALQQQAPLMPPSAKSRKAFVLLGGLAAAALLTYLAVNVLVPLSPAYLARPSAALIDRLPLWAVIEQLPLPVPSNATEVGRLLLRTSVVSFVVYVLALLAIRRVQAGPGSAAFVFGSAAVFGLITVLTLPNFSGDLYWYALFGRAMPVYGLNPYTPMPVETFLSDPLWPFVTHSRDMASTPYGPVWTYVSSVLMQFSGNDPVWALLSLRLFLYAVSLGSLVLIWVILGRVAPKYQLVGALFYAWNPIVVLEAPGHLDTLMVFFTLLAVVLHLHNRIWLAVIALTIASLVKFFPAPLLAAYIVFLWRRRSFRTAAIGAGLAALVTFFAFLPVFTEWSMFWQIAREPGGQSGSAFSLRRLIFLPGLLALLLWSGWRRTNPALLKGWAVVMLWSAIFLMNTTYDWYLLILIGIVSLVDSDEITSLTLAACFSLLITTMLVQVGKPYFEVPSTLARAIRWGPPLLTSMWILHARYGGALLRLVGWKRSAGRVVEG